MHYLKPIQKLNTVDYKQNTHAHVTAIFVGLHTQVCQYRKGKTNLYFTKARDSEWQWHHYHKQVCTSLQTDNHVRTPPLKQKLDKNYFTQN